MLIANRCILVVLIGVFLFLTGCQRGTERRFELKGKVVSVDKPSLRVTISHEQIKGYMDAMTMPFNVKDSHAISMLEPGQGVEATLVVQGDRSWLEGLKITQAGADNSTDLIGSMPAIGDEVPDFQLMNQDQRQIHISQYRGRPLLLTFIYTRCPLPDYCPKTSRNFYEVYRGLPSIKTSQPETAPFDDKLRYRV